MPQLQAERLSTLQPGTTDGKATANSPSSPARQQFYFKYLAPVDSPAVTGELKVRNMVVANKEERQQEKQVCNFIVQRVLNRGSLTRITGITTRKDLDQLAAKRLRTKQNREANATQSSAKVKGPLCQSPQPKQGAATA